MNYIFKNEALRARALTTPSFRMHKPDAQDNQRLEFLGDSVLGLLSAEELFLANPSEQEGSLTVQRTHMVSTSALCAAGVRLGIVEELRRNPGAAPLKEDSKTIADAVEALLGAAYLDGGMEAARMFYAELELSAHAERDESVANPKGKLQILAQSAKPPVHPVYETIDVSGKAHEPVFTVRVRVEGLGEAEASAGNRKVAESQAAAKLLAKLAEERTV